MRRAETLVLIVVSPLLLATDISISPEDAPRSDDEKREILERYNHEVDGVIELQIQEIAALVPTGEIERLRKNHYAWKLERELECSEKGRSESDRLAELECRSKAAEIYYQDLELRIVALEEKRDDRVPMPDTPHNKPMQTDEP